MNNIKSNLDTLDLNILQTKNNNCYIGLRNGSLRLASQLFKIKQIVVMNVPSRSIIAIITTKLK